MPDRTNTTQGSATPLCEASHNGVSLPIVVMVLSQIKAASDGYFD